MQISLPHPRRSLQQRAARCIGLLSFACRLALAQSSPVPARSVPLLLPSAIAYDTSGNLYIAETQRHAIRRVDPLGNITTVAGDGTQGFSGDLGPAVGAQLNSPQGVAVDSAGNLYISDSGNNRVRRVDAATQTLRTVAGTGTAAFSGDGGSAAGASLDLPAALCLDPSGKNLYIADTRHHRIRRVDLVSGTIDTVAGDGVQGFSGDGASATSASLDSPDSIAIDQIGNLYIAEAHNHRLRRVAAGAGIISTVLGTGAVGSSNAAATPLSLPRGLAVDLAGNIYVADSGSHRLLRVDHATGLLSVAAGDSTQGFAGDAGPATQATLDAPRGLALSPGGLISIADAGSQRVRQLLSDPVPATLIQTIAGLGAAGPGALSISAPTVTAYGSGTASATLLSPSAAGSGQVTFLDVGGGASLVIGAAPLAGNVATVSLSALPAGQHRVMATYPGDAAHAAAQSSTASLVVSQIALRATPAYTTIVYGSAFPTLGGVLDGVLPQDANRVGVLFSTPVTPSSPAGTYPISIALTGEAAPDYLLQPASADLLVTPAPSAIILRNESPDGSFTGAVRAQVNSATTGTPSGFVTLLDNGVTLRKAAVSSAGSALFPALALPAGTHSLAALYSGEQNFLPSSSSSLSESISAPVAADFAIAAVEPSSQTLVAGGSLTYALSIQMTGDSLSSPVALSVSGLPAFTRAAFTPGYLPPGAAKVTPLTLTVTSFASSARQTPARSAWDSSSVLAIILPLSTLLIPRSKSIRALGVPTLALALLALCLTASLTGCGARINSTGQAGNPPLVYNLTVTGTATSSSGAPIAHSASLILQMSSAK